MARKIFTSAVIGLGNIGMGYDLAHHSDYVQTHTRAYMQHQGYQLSFGVDPDAKKREDFKRLAGAPSYASLKEAARHFSSVDVVSVCVAVEHRQDLWRLLEGFRPKVVIVEKPLARSTKEAKEILAWGRSKKIRVCVNYLRRFDPSTFELKAAFDRKKFGRVTGADIRYNGGFYNNASHYIDMMLFLFGRPKSFKQDRIRKIRKDFDVDFRLEYSDRVVNGRSVDVACPVGELTFWCEKAQVCYRKFGQQIDVLTPQPDPVFRKFNELAKDVSIKSCLAYAMGRMIDDVYDLCCGSGKLASSGEDALETLKICERIVLKR